MGLSSLLTRSNSRKFIVGGFLAVPILTSLISAIHIYTFFSLGNAGWMALLLAVAYELGSLASFLVLTVMDKVKRYIVWSIFLLLAFMQVTGNLYAVFDFVNGMLKSDPNWLKSFQELFSYFIDGEPQTFTVLLTTIIAAPISLISLAFLKSLVDYVPSVQDVPEESTIGEPESDTSATAPEPVESSSVPYTASPEVIVEYDPPPTLLSDTLEEPAEEIAQRFKPVATESIQFDPDEAQEDTITPPRRLTVAAHNNTL